MGSSGEGLEGLVAVLLCPEGSKLADGTLFIPVGTYLGDCGDVLRFILVPGALHTGATRVVNAAKNEHDNYGP